jgi:hypothetical protein
LKQRKEYLDNYYSGPPRYLNHLSSANSQKELANRANEITNYERAKLFNLETQSNNLLKLIS